MANRRRAAALVRGGAGALLAAVVLAGGCGRAGPPPAVTSPPAAPAAPTPGPVATSPAPSPALAPPAPAPAAALPGALALEPPDGRWLRDASGREYFLSPLAKRYAVRIDERTVRTAWAVPVEVEREDEAFYYYRVYRPPAPARRAPAPRVPAADAAAYQVSLPESDRLKWRAFDRGLPQAGQWRDGFTVADVNGDGHPDLVHGPARKTLRPPAIFLGDSRGGWRLWREADFPPLSYDYGDAQVGDLDGDGHPDLVLAVHLRGIIALRGDGRGRFTDFGQGLDFSRPGTEGSGSGFPTRAVRLVDWDGDGRLDILALSEGPRLARAPGGGGPGVGRSAGAQGVALYRNQGDGTWARRDEAPGRRLFGTSLAIGDLDGDGRPDFVTGSSIFGRQDILHLADGAGGWRPVVVPEVRPRAYVRAVAVGDLDGDGRLDLVLAYQTIEPGTWWTGVDALLARPGGVWQRVPLSAQESRSPAAAVAVGDVDGDGRRDVVALLPGAVAVFLGDGRGGFTRERSGPRFSAPCRGSHVALADLDGDGALEIAASFAEERDALQGTEEGCRSGGGLAAWHLVR